MAYLLPLGIYNKNSPGVFKGPWLLVNPESVEIKRSPSLATARTMAGNVFQSWPNKPDEVRFSGIFYGIRSFYEIRVITGSTNEPTSSHEVDLIYKYQKYSGYINDLKISARGDKPWVYDYSFNFISKDAINLARLMLGNINSPLAESSYANGVFNNIAGIAKSKSLDDALVLNSLYSTGNAVYFYATGELPVKYLLGNTTILVSMALYKNFRNLISKGKWK